jgi:hypothetical protein
VIKLNLESLDFARMGPVFGCSLRDSMTLLMSNGSIPLKHYMRIIFINTCSIVGIPFRIREYMMLNRKIKKTKLHSDPIFIIGHWRSGTTHLHNLLCQDPQFGYVTMLEASFPKCFMTNSFFRYLMSIMLPKKRPMDNMKMGVDKAQEDEMALANIFPYTLYNAWYFPKRMMEFYYKYLRFKNISSKVSKEWKKGYISLLKKTTINMDGKRLVSKNPPNTARIKFLLNLFPEAKFIHIYRNPYTVYLSTRHFYRKTMERFTFQRVSSESIEENIFKIYKDLMKTYFNEYKLIPKGNLVEIKFEDLETDAIGQLKKIYSELNLSGFKKNKSRFQNYLDQIENYSKNKFQLDNDTIKKVEQNWDFTIKKWEYSIPDS